MNSSTSNHRFLFVIVVWTMVALAQVISVFSQSGGSVAMRRNVIAGGGDTSTGSGNLRISGTVGQPAAGTQMSGGVFKQVGGFWTGAGVLNASTVSVPNVSGTFGGTVSLTATLTAGGANLSGRSISFSLNGKAVGTATTDANGLATMGNVSLSGINGGSYPAGVSAQFAGDLSFAAGAGAGQLTVQPATPLLQVTGGTYTFDGQSHPAIVSLTGINNEPLSPVTVLYNGGSAGPVNAGAYSITASFAGNQNYKSVTNSQQSIVVNQATQSINFGFLAGKTFGDADLKVDATASSSLIVAFKAAGNCTVNGATVHLTGAGSCTITASQGGNANYTPAADVVRSFDIGQASSATALASSANPSVLGQAVSFTGTVTAIAGTPTGTIQFKDNGTNLGSPVAVNANGHASFNTASLTAGTHTITAEYSGDVNFNASAATLLNGQVVNAQPTTGGIISFSAGNYTVPESGRLLTIAVTRTGDTSTTATVDYATSDDSDLAKVVSCAAVTSIASSRCDFTSAAGTLKFAAGESVKTFDVLISQDSYVEGPETFPITLSNATGGAVLGVQSTTNVTIVDDLLEPATNPIDDADNFVRQQYHDFLNREGDPQGQDFWTSRITGCGTDAACIQRERIGVSAQFFIEQEFQQTGFYVYRVFKGALGRRPTYVELLTDRSELQANPNLDAEKVTYSLDVVRRAEFTARYQSALNGQDFVDALILNVRTNTGVDLAATRNELLAVYNSGSDQNDSRARTLRAVVDHADFKAAEYNRAFVLAQYFGYLRREPDQTGYNFWLNVLNSDPGNFRGMVCSFITSAEYQDRSGLVRTHGNQECSGSAIATTPAP